MRTVCITVSGAYSRAAAPGDRHPNATEAAAKHFADVGLKTEFFVGVNAPHLGLETKLAYEVDNPGSGFNIGQRCVGCWLSHRTLWAALMLLPEDYFLVLEDDAKFSEGWSLRLEKALIHAPPDWDMIYVGSCCTSDKPQKHIGGDVFEVKYPMCTHGYLVRKKALPVLIETQDAAKLYAPIDISLVFHSLEKLRVYTVLPQIVDQWGTTLSH